ncbi:MAG: A/G-specific adenine glycosylase [Cyclobacteriaceae bacterium]|nr:A/G-specific adenine glycosylase [Cyclobacteriaceae bacterium HetDA_MAG_MS6]
MVSGVKFKFDLGNYKVKVNFSKNSLDEEKSALAHIITSWYHQHKRDLPWRRTKNPYHVWLSEIILQQTRVAQGLPYFDRFVATFPTVTDLANADEQDVLRLWQGLGYYSRARNLHKAAKTVTEKYSGRFPETYKELLNLPGVGPYTAAAIGSICFDAPEPVLDGNVYRVIARLFGIDADIANPKSRGAFMDVLYRMIPNTNAGDFNQAMMEFGARVCTPKAPECNQCLVNDSCFAFKYGKQDLLPVKIKKVKVKTRYFHYIVLQVEGGLAMRRRGPSDIWQGLYDFHLVESQESSFDVHSLGLPVAEVSPQIKHILTHRIIKAKFYLIAEQESIIKDLINKWNLEVYSYEQIVNLPKPKLIVDYLQQLDF